MEHHGTIINKYVQRTKADLCARRMTSTRTQTLPEDEGRPAAAKHQVKICKH